MTLEGYTSNRPDPNNIPANIKQGEYIYGVGPGTYNGGGIAGRTVKYLCNPTLRHSGDAGPVIYGIEHGDNILGILYTQDTDEISIYAISKVSSDLTIIEYDGGISISYNLVSMYYDSGVIHINRNDSSDEHADYDIDTKVLSAWSAGLDTTGTLINSNTVISGGLTYLFGFTTGDPSVGTIIPFCQIS